MGDQLTMMSNTVPLPGTLHNTNNTDNTNNISHPSISITSINIRSHTNLSAVVLSCPSDVLLVTELNAKSSDLRGIISLMLRHGYNTHVHRSDYMRTAIFLRRHLRLATGASDSDLLSVVLQSRPPVVVATQYVPPKDFAQAVRTSTALRHLAVRFQHLPLVVAGDINFTTNEANMVTGLVDITPPEPNYCTSRTVRGGTRPSRILTTQDTTHMVQHAVVEAVPFGDGHRALHFSVAAASVRGLTIA
eukprot:PhM_4_TR18081/c1_g2_i3/m.106384